MTTPSPPTRPPARPDVASHFSTVRRRRWLPSLAVLATILATVLGGFVTAAALSEPVGTPVEVGGVVRVRPLSGWELAQRWVFDGSWEVSGVAVSDVPGATLTRGTGNLDVVAVVGYGGATEDLARWYENEVLARQLTRLSVSSTFDDVRSVSGSTALRFAYVGAGRGGIPIEGEVTVVVSPGGTGAIFDGWATQGLLSFTLGDIHTMIDAAAVT